MLTTIQVVVALALTALILIQENSGGLSGILGASAASSGYQTRRGLEKVTLYATIAGAIAFFVLAILNLAV